MKAKYRPKCAAEYVPLYVLSLQRYLQTKTGGARLARDTLRVQAL